MASTLIDAAPTAESLAASADDCLSPWVKSAFVVCHQIFGDSQITIEPIGRPTDSDQHFRLLSDSGAWTYDSEVGESSSTESFFKTSVLLCRSQPAVRVSIASDLPSKVLRSIAIVLLRFLANEITQSKLRYSTSFLGGLGKGDDRPAVSQSPVDPTLLAKILRVATCSDDCLFWSVSNVGKRRKLEVRAFTRDGTNTPPFDMWLGRGVAGTVGQKNIQFTVDDIQNSRDIQRLLGAEVSHKESVDKFDWRGAAFLPIALHDEVLAVTSCYSKVPIAYTAAELMIMRSVLAPYVLDVMRTKDIARSAMLSRQLAIEVLRNDRAIRSDQTMHDVARSLETTSLRLQDAASFLGTSSREIESKKILAVIKEKVKTATSQLFDAISGDRATGPNVDDLEPVLTEMRLLIDQVLMDYKGKFRSLGIEHSVTGKIEYEVEVDRQAMQRIVRNLLDNSVYFLTDHSGRRRITITLQQQDREWVSIKVFDTGPGIDPANLARIFDPYFSTRGLAGKGLGLSSARTLVELHGGTLICSSAWGRSAEFVVRLPIRYAPPAQIV